MNENYMKRRNNETLKDYENNKIKFIPKDANFDNMNYYKICKYIERYCTN